ncbi:BTB/POZ domain-containing protein KCTD12-like isoform X1 [Mya arenaria]|nr:BTB/POZ domain-containing protein KCTD12-like isoform X1 [Mya arenaria]
MASEEFPGVIELNVGGTHTFTTHLSTLTKHKDSRLADMFTGRADVHKDKDGRYFLDVDGSTFAVILDYMKYGFTPDQNPNQDFKTDEIMRLYASTLSLGLKDLSKHLENHFPLLVENKHIFGSAMFPTSECVRELHIGEPGHPSQPDGRLFGAQSRPIPQRTSFGRSGYPQKTVFGSYTPPKPVFGQNAAETHKFGQSSPFKLTPASTFGQPSSQGEVREKSLETESLASPKQQQQQQPHNFGKLPEFCSPFRHIESPAPGSLGLFGESATGGSEMPTLTDLGQYGAPKVSNELKFSDDEGPPTK